jgi:hypothetical protein
VETSRASAIAEKSSKSFILAGPLTYLIVPFLALMSNTLGKVMPRQSQVL